MLTFYIFQKYCLQEYKIDTFQIFLYFFKGILTCILSESFNIFLLLFKNKLALPVLLLLVAMVAVEGSKWSHLPCYWCYKMMDHCTFRCQMQPTFAKWYYCSDYCDRRNIACESNCKPDKEQILFMKKA